MRANSPPGYQRNRQLKDFSQKNRTQDLRSLSLARFLREIRRNAHAKTQAKTPRQQRVGGKSLSEKCVSPTS